MEIRAQSQGNDASHFIPVGNTVKTSSQPQDDEILRGKVSVATARNQGGERDGDTELVDQLRGIPPSIQIHRLRGKEVQKWHKRGADSGDKRRKRGGQEWFTLHTRPLSEQGRVAHCSGAKGGDSPEIG
jgi:hypothetical protein